MTTFWTVTLSLFVGTTIQGNSFLRIFKIAENFNESVEFIDFDVSLVAQYGSTWHTTSSTIVSPYSAFTKQRMSAEIGGYIGLMHINITYRGMDIFLDD